MSKLPVIAIAAVLSVACITAANADKRRTSYGIYWDEVPWESFCAEIKPLKYVGSSGHTCPKVHPADSRLRKWKDITGRDKPEPLWNCEFLAGDYEKLAHNTGACKSTFASILNARENSPEDFTESFETWRNRYFGPWLVAK